MKISSEDFEKELQFRTSRSGGKGGQNVNKVETKVELLWDYRFSALFNDDEKLKIGEKLKHRINKESIFQVVAEEERTQLRNKEIAIKKAIYLIEESLVEVKKRKASKPSYTAIKKRLDDKRKVALKKINRDKRFDF